MTDTPMIQMDRVSCAHEPGGPNFLRDISFTIRPGEWVSIVGANGSGKSSLVKRLNGLLPMSSGRIVVDGIELTDATVGDIRERIGMVFANPDNQFVGLTVADDIVFGLENRRMSRPEMADRLARYADKLGITEYLNRHPAELSGGQKQRVALAGVLAMEPQVVVLDEATSMLDEQAKTEMLAIIRDMRRDGAYTLLSVTHDTDEMLASDRMLAIADGHLVADGTPRELLTDLELVRRLRLTPSFGMALSRELAELGLPIPPLSNEGELMEALWRLNSSK
ncbi:ATP-binding cassette domain-containing protein [Gorillibacterium sp. CAU 1737]|uniref:ATP-binding cassette domain-containing protein n=1 Tax=Gorillibacterium sp. CAU 1737 TaxID=3140362 RepID=UPI00326076ED